jgi:tetratricopeptide (TPR) repeat protein
MNILVVFYAFRSKSRLSRYLAIALIAMLFQNIFSETLSSFVPFFLYVLTLIFILSEVFPPAIDKKLSKVVVYPLVVLMFPLNLLISFISINLLLSDFYLRKAIYLSESKEFDKAELFYKEALKRNYYNPLAHYLLGNLYLQRSKEGDGLKALRCYEKVEALAGNFLQVYLFKGLAYLKMGDEEKMRLYFKKAFINDPPLFYQMNRVFQELKGV